MGKKIHGLSKKEHEILEFLRGRKGVSSTLEIMAGTSIWSYDTIWHALQRLRHKGLVVKSKRGKYKIVK